MLGQKSLDHAVGGEAIVGTGLLAGNQPGQIGEDEADLIERPMGDRKSVV